MGGNSTVARGPAIPMTIPVNTKKTLEVHE
jgi:hypothetical protein